MVCYLESLPTTSRSAIIWLCQMFKYVRRAVPNVYVNQYENYFIRVFKSECTPVDIVLTALYVVLLHPGVIIRSSLCSNFGDLHVPPEICFVPLIAIANPGYPSATIFAVKGTLVEPCKSCRVDMTPLSPRWRRGQLFALDSVVLHSEGSIAESSC